MKTTLFAIFSMLLPLASGFAYDKTQAGYYFGAWVDGPQEPVVIDGRNAFIFCETHLPKPSQDSDLVAAAYDGDWYHSDEFTKHDLITQLMPLIQQAVATAKTVKTIRVQYHTSLPPYDFKLGGFDLNFINQTIMYRYSMGAMNCRIDVDVPQGGNIIPVPIESARTLETTLAVSRDVTVTLDGSIVKAGYEDGCKAFWIHPSKITVMLGQQEVGERSIP